MPVSETWNTFEDWGLWVDETDPSGNQSDLRRLVGNTIKLPYEQIEIEGSTVFARWRFGQNQDGSDATGNGNTATLQSGAEITELGLSLPTKSAHATVAEISDFDLSDPFFLALWCKSTITDYSSDQRHIVAGFTKGSGNGEIQYAIGVVDNNPDSNIDNELVGFVHDNSGSTKISIPYMSEFEESIDTKWHVIVMYVSTPVSTSAIDNNIDGDQVQLVTYASVSGSPEFSIGASQFDTSTGFVGIIDEVTILQGSLSEFPLLYRFLPHVYLSPIVDTGRSLSVVSSILVDYENPNGSTITFAFRASDTLFDQDDTSIPWTGFTGKEQIPSLTDVDLADIGIFTQGRYHQIKMELSPSADTSPDPDPLRTETPTVSSLTINTSPPDLVIHPTQSAYQPGVVLGQLVNFSGDKRIDKVSLNLSVTINDRRDFIIGDSNRVSFSAANFQSSRNEWVFQPIPIWADDYGWITSAMTLSNTLQTESYTDVEDAVENAPYLNYNFYLPTGGVWEMWGLGWVPNGIWYGVDGDTTHLRKLLLGQNISGFTGVPFWTKFGNMFFEEGGLHKFTVYLNSTDTIYLDQWLFTNQDFERIITESGQSGFVTPVPRSRGPFNTVVRLRSLENGEPVPLTDPPSGSSIIAAYKPSTLINGSGKFNYAVQNSTHGTGVTFTDGVFIEYIHIGGNADFFASWDYKFV